MLNSPNRRTESSETITTSWKIDIPRWLLMKTPVFHAGVSLTQINAGLDRRVLSAMGFSVRLATES
jgi:hypothetical protein